MFNLTLEDIFHWNLNSIEIVTQENIFKKWSHILFALNVSIFSQKNIKFDLENGFHTSVPLGIGLPINLIFKGKENNNSRINKKQYFILSQDKHNAKHNYSHIQSALTMDTQVRPE